MSDEKNTAQPVGVLQTVDTEGRVHNSSKRWMGTALIISGGLLLIAVGIVAIFRTIADPETSLQAGQVLIITGAALLGVGVLDGIGKAIGLKAGGGK
jgi:uncharacterized membrane protein YidH (DUF202 family)